jgi:UDP-N-acetylglucosamine 1-carboxyvinyltransferase
MMYCTCMSQLVIEGGHKLVGTINAGSSKNAALPLIAASLLTKESITLHKIPHITDAGTMLTMLTAMGAEMNRADETVKITALDISQKRIPRELVGHLRGSILLIGALLGRDRMVSIPKPGGDIIGARPMDTPLDAFRQLGAKISKTKDSVQIDGSNMQSGVVILREFSVTATENILLSAATLTGTTTIKIAATEPHIVALAGLLNKMGAKVRGAGTHTITVTGSNKLRGTTYTNIPDMLEAGFFILLAAATKSPLRINNVPTQDLELFFKKLDDIGLKYQIQGSTVTVIPSPLKSFSMQSLPHPGIPTDLQAPFSVVATQATGASLIHDPLYEGRLRHCGELAKMGAKINITDPHRVIIEGPTKLKGQHIQSLDLRAGATLLMAGLIASGITIVDNAEIIERGYANLPERLRAIGAHLKVKQDTMKENAT